MAANILHLSINKTVSKATFSIQEFIYLTDDCCPHLGAADSSMKLDEKDGACSRILCGSISHHYTDSQPPSFTAS